MQVVNPNSLVDRFSETMKVVEHLEYNIQSTKPKLGKP
jgi:hypothetical protein